MLRVIVAFRRPGCRRIILLYGFAGNNSTQYMKRNRRKKETRQSFSVCFASFHVFEKKEKAFGRKIRLKASGRRRRDSNPRAPEGKRISSAPRYDRFDTSPYNINEIFFLSDGILFRTHQTIIYYKLFPLIRQLNFFYFPAGVLFLLFSRSGADEKNPSAWCCILPAEHCGSLLPDD